jgi:hypothetical protein
MAQGRPRCVECGFKENLEYDHIIPVSKGGSNTERNVQLLCERCNRTKRDKIMFDQYACDSFYGEIASDRDEHDVVPLKHANANTMAVILATLITAINIAVITCQRSSDAIGFGLVL